MTRNFSKVSLLQALAKSKGCDIICLSQMFFDSLIDNNDDRISILRYHNDVDDD